MSYLGKFGSRFNRASTACIAALPSAMPFWYILWLSAMIGCIPFQVICSLNEPGEDYEGGELLLIEQRPRAQSIGHVLVPRRGEAVVITTRYRPVQGSRGFYRANVRHGVSTVRSGQRHTLGIIFHDAK